MLPLLFAMIVFFFMLVGAVAFLLCVMLPPARRFALSTALWCTTLGPCSVALMTLAGLALVTAAFVTKNGEAQSLHSPKLLSAFGWGYLIAGTVSTAVLATAVAWLHQFVSHRLTFALFRLYATGVVAGIGSVFGWCLTWWMISSGSGHVWLWSALSMLLLIGAFGVTAYKGARSLRGRAPQTFTWISQEEFIGYE